jgi:tRNA threonylcarbamoyladenosine biosynthesis protein TsaE
MTRLDDAADPRARTAWCMRSGSPAETRALAECLGRIAAPGDRLGLIGDLGAGKTEFARGFAAGLGVRAVVSSPSFTLMSEYDGRLRLFHIDLYRLSGAADAVAGGLFDERQQDGVSLVEWADRITGPLGGVDLEVHIDGSTGDHRVIRLVGHGSAGARYVESAARGPGSAA